MSLNKLIEKICKETVDKHIENIDKLLDELVEFENLEVLDIYPFQIMSNEKFSQVEVFF